MLQNPTEDLIPPVKWWDDLPGGTLVWLVFVLEMVTFALFFMVFAWLSRSEQSLYQSGQVLLHPKLGTINTLILLTGSWMAARAVQAGALQQNTRLWLSGVSVSGLIFMGIKAWEYQHLFQNGISLSSSNFWFFYLFLTLLHNAHVALGVVFMAYLAIKQKKQLEAQSSLEAAAIYWHLVDIIWVILFPLIYFTH